MEVIWQYFSYFLQVDILISFMILLFMEIVLGIDNILLLTMFAQRLPKSQQSMGYKIGLGFAIITRILFLVMINWLYSLRTPLFIIGKIEISWWFIIVVFGGGFLMVKAAQAIIHERTHGSHMSPPESSSSRSGFLWVIIQVGLIDIVFSIDTVVSAVGLSGDLPVMVAAILGSASGMVFFA